eukprot:34405-Pleurochrysis_carterae.AAC.6
MRRLKPLPLGLAGKAARRAAQQLHAGQRRQRSPGLQGAPRPLRWRCCLHRGKFSINALRHKLGNDVCLPVALSLKTNPLAVCDCYGQPGHEELGHDAHKIPLSARAVADAARLRSNNLRPHPADGASAPSSVSGRLALAVLLTPTA